MTGHDILEDSYNFNIKSVNKWLDKQLLLITAKDRTVWSAMIVNVKKKKHLKTSTVHVK